MGDIIEEMLKSIKTETEETGYVRWSKSAGKWIPVKEMHLNHIFNVLREDFAWMTNEELADEPEVQALMAAAVEKMGDLTNDEE